MSAVEDIKAAIDIVDLVSENVKLRRTGKNYIGFCPFHANTHTPAFVVFPESQNWKCFGQCGEGGDIFTYVMKRDGCDFQQALETLAQKAGIELTEYRRSDEKPKEAKQRLYDLMEEAVRYYHNNLLAHPAGKNALDFLAKRGLTNETIEKFSLGYALQSWDALIQYLYAKGYTRKELVDTGMVSEQRDDKGDVIPNGRIYDRYRNRVMIPIRDSRGYPIGFGARILDPNDSPKFLNSPQTELFDKGKTLFALNEAKRSIREKDQVVLVEGYMDVIVLHQAGFTNTVSPMGTALTDFQAKQLTRQTKRIVLALDADAAGDHGALRGIDVIRSVLKEGSEETADGQTLLRQETKLNADIRVTRIPDGMDPDEVVLRDPDEWQEILNNAKPIVIHLMESAAEGKDLNDAKVKAEIAEKIMPLIREVPNVIERETYRQQLARFLDINEALLNTAGMTAAPVQQGKRPFPAKPQSLQQKPQLIFDPKDSFYAKENEILRCLYHYYDTPGALAAIDRLLRNYKLKPISMADFEQTDLHEISACYFSALNQDEELDLKAYMEERIPDSIMGAYQRIKTAKRDPETEMSSLNEEVARSLAYLRQEKCEYERKTIRELLENDSEQTEAFEQMMNDSITERRQLDKLIEALNRIDFSKGKEI